MSHLLYIHNNLIILNVYILIIDKTKDGGKAWTEIGNTNETSARVVTGVGFLDDKVGFVGFRYEDNNNLIVYRTDDEGSTWKELEINLPYEYASDYATPISLYVKCDKVMLPVKTER